MRGYSLPRATLFAAAAAACLCTAVPEAKGGGRDFRFRGCCVGACDGHRNVMWRHRGLGEGCFGATGVRRFHGLGDGYCSGSFYNPFLYEPYNQVIVVIESPGAAPPDARGGVYATSAAPAPAVAPATQTELAWSLLNQGRPREALREFAILSLRDAADGEPRVGYGLASAMLADDEKAAWAFRRALAIDAPSLVAQDLQEPLSGWIRQLIESLSKDPKPDRLLLVAALHAVLHEDTAAISAIEQAKADPAAPALRRLLGIEEEPREAAPAGVERIAAR